VKSISPAKRRLFTAVTLSLPLLLFAGLEVALRVAGYGHDLSLFLEHRVNGVAYFVMNPEVANRYFVRTDFNPSTSPDYFPVVKGPRSFRIFCLGGSTTVGYPYWYCGAFSSFLRQRLRATFPEKEIEVINLGLTATNSFTTLDIARELFPYQPDLIIVYDGHNEFYGALGVASNESVGVSRFFTQAYLRLIHLRIFVLLRDLGVFVGGKFRARPEAEPTGTMMERLARGQYVPFNSNTYRISLTSFRANLEDLRELCTQHGVPLMVSSQVSNLKDQPPFYCGPSPGRTPEEQLTFNTHMNRGISLLLDGKPDSALAVLRPLLLLDSLRADIHYNLGRAYLSLRRRSEALGEFVKSRDFDQLRFRTSSDFNDAIRSLGDNSRTIFVDIERAFIDNSPDSIIGRPILLEHLHPALPGYFLMAREYARAMREHGLLATPSDWAARDTINDLSFWNDRRVTPLDELAAQRRTQILTSGWPFTDHPPRVRSIDVRDTLGQLADKLTRGTLGWLEAHQAAAQYYAQAGNPSMQAQEYLTIIDQVPLIDVQVYLRLARLLLDQQRVRELREVLVASLRVEPTILACRALGDIALRAGNAAESVEYYSRTIEFPQTAGEQVENRYLLALALSRAGKSQEAVSHLHAVLAINPEHQPSRALLASILQHR
jgi:tetratricopeptide (TPR) repeat protein